MLRPRDPCGVEVGRGFVDLPHGRAHYRMAGAGPAVIALHASPSSSLALLPVLEALAERCTVIAPDTPGYGLSDPLTIEQPSLEDFADTLAQVLDALKLDRVAVYGTHTGAAIAAMFAARYPDRVSRLVLDGVSAFTPAEVERFRTAYLTPYEPHWDGRHVMSLWSRVRDLYTWFPWHDRTAARRLAFEPPALPVLEKSALGFIQAGAHYHKAYIRAAALDPAPLLRRARAPTLLMARDTDLIADHLDRIETGPWEVRRVKEGQDWAALLTEAFASVDQDGSTMVQAPDPAPGETGGFLRLGDGWLNLHARGPMEGPLRLCLPDLPGDARAMAQAQSAAFPADRILAVDLPGCGWSDPLARRAQGLDQILDVLDEVLKRICASSDSVTVIAQGATGIVGRVWRSRREARGFPAFDLELPDMPHWFDEPTALPQTPPLAWIGPRWDGTHLTGAWMQLRDRLMYDAPPGAGPCVRAPNTENCVDVERLDRLFRLYVEGPDCAEVLAWCIDAVREQPDLMSHRAIEESGNRIPGGLWSIGRKGGADLTGSAS